jgi:hypothetical protein
MGKQDSISNAMGDTILAANCVSQSMDYSYLGITESDTG